jgi:ribonucrease Y
MTLENFAEGMFYLFSGILLFGLGYVLRSLNYRRALRVTENNIQNMLDMAKREADSVLREAKLQARDEVNTAREKFEASTNERHSELRKLEERLSAREVGLDRRLESMERKETALEERIDAFAAKENEVEAVRVQLEEQKQELITRIEGVAQMDRETARTEFIKTLEGELTSERAALVRRSQQEAHESAERDARKIIALAVERYAAEQINEMTTCAVPLPGEEMKGRIIGKEGRNIRAIEAATGVNILIDDTPETVVISGFDPLRREIARQSLVRLINDGRIHPSRIEEIVHGVQAEIAGIIEKAGEKAFVELDLQSVDPAIENMVGRLQFRHSYGQNVLKHSIEMGHLMGMMASELGIDPAIARRVGLLHDIGKAMDHDIEGSHALIGAEYLKKYGETPLVVNAVAAHHNEVEAESIYAILARAGDAMTAARPGARSENTEIYLKRLEKLEQIATSYRGVEKCYAIQAGREIRVIVEPTAIDDSEALLLARNISRQIEHDMQYPGQIKVTVVRETRCVEYAK